MARLDKTLQVEILYDCAQLLPVFTDLIEEYGKGQSGRKYCLKVLWEVIEENVTDQRSSRSTKDMWCTGFQEAALLRGADLDVAGWFFDELLRRFRIKLATSSR